MKHKSTLFLILTILTAVMIFCFSAQDGEDSSALSGGLSVAVAKIIKPGFDQLPIVEQESLLSSLGFIIRKIAHFSEFALLGFNLAWYLLLRADKRAFPLRCCRLSWLLSTLYAGTDELHQMFVADRGPAILDVGIDSCGALFGVAVVYLLFRYGRSGSPMTLL